MPTLIGVLKVAASIAVAWLGYVVLDPARWAVLQAPLGLTIPADFYAMRLERLWFGGTIVLLGALCAVSAIITTARRA